jgi:hypothetical protein
MAPAVSSFAGNSWLVKASKFDTLGSNQLFPLIFEKPAWGLCQDVATLVAI